MPPDKPARFSAMYHLLWQLAVALSAGSASALIGLLAGRRPAAVGDFRVAFLVEAGVTPCALLAYRRLSPEDGRTVSGHAEIEAGAG